MQSLRAIWQRVRPVLMDERVMLGLWVLIGVVSAVTKCSEGAHNNFLIYRGTFYHALQGLPLYGPYPEEYGDVNLYGPLFSLVIAPFALLPESLGLVVWNVGLTLLLYVSLRSLKLNRYQWVFMLWFCAHELLTALFMQQFNVAVVALVVASYALVRDEKDVWAALCVVVGTMVKIYGIVGVVFFLFSRHKGRYVAAGVLWAVVLFAAPMVLSSWDYVCSQYGLWYEALAHKGEVNEICLMQNISLLGMIRKVGYACSVGLTPFVEGIRSGAVPEDCFWSRYSDIWVIVPGLVLLGMPYVRWKQWGNERYRLTLLAGVLMFVCLFSTGTESSSYIIAFVGVVLWFTAAPWKRGGWEIGLMVVAFVLTSLSPSDLFPAYIRREWVQPFALKALPVAVVWLQMTYELLNRDYADSL